MNMPEYEDFIPSNIVEIPLEQIVFGTNQARQRDTKVDDDDDLVLSIKKNGLLIPIILKQTDAQFAIVQYSGNLL